MAGTSSGGKKTAQINKQRHGEDFYIKIGALGGAKSRNGGFAVNRELAREAGRLGGSRSRRNAKAKVETESRDTEKSQTLWRKLKGIEKQDTKK